MQSDIFAYSVIRPYCIAIRGRSGIMCGGSPLNWIAWCVDMCTIFSCRGDYTGEEI